MADFSRFILRCADEIQNKVVAADWGTRAHGRQVALALLKNRIEVLLDEARPGSARAIDDDQIAGVI